MYDDFSSYVKACIGFIFFSQMCFVRVSEGEYIYILTDDICCEMFTWQFTMIFLSSLDKIFRFAWRIQMFLGTVNNGWPTTPYNTTMTKDMDHHLPWCSQLVPVQHILTSIFVYLVFYFFSVIVLPSILDYWLRCHGHGWIGCQWAFFIYLVVGTR